MRSTYKRLGPFIREVVELNRNLEVELLLGVSVSKEFIPSIANTIGTDMSRYKIARRKQFAYGPVTSRNSDKVSIALLDEQECIISTSYTIFEIIDKDLLLPEYLMMWFRRPEFDRYARFMSHGSVRELFGWDEMCEVELPIPSIDKQREIVNEYQTVVDRIQLNERLNAKLEEAAQAIYKHWFVEFEFPMTAEYADSIGKPELAGQPYKSSGGEMVYNEVLEQEIPRGWAQGTLSDIAAYSYERILMTELTKANYISTENMISNRGGITHAFSMPTTANATKFSSGDILISNIRPYFKKIWLAEFTGGCSNDVLAIVPKKNFYSLLLYQVLEQDHFFDYVMAGSKGTKMPRGDKTWIMDYPVLIADVNVLESLVKILTLTTAVRVHGRREIELCKVLAETLLAKLAASKVDGQAA